MIRLYYYAIALSIIIQTIGCLKNVGQRVSVENCENNTQYLINLLSLSCEYIAPDLDDIVTRNDCIQCFTSASRANNNQPSLSELATCSALYFTSNRFLECSDIISAATTTIRNGCVSGYCNFVRCVRRMNSNILISRCYSEASADNEADLEEEQITLYKNITSCVLARARCLNINPITGQRQSNIISQTSYDKFGKPMTTTVQIYNSLQINRAGDLRILAFPGTTSLGTYLCPFESNLAQTGWANLNC